MNKKNTVKEPNNVFLSLDMHLAKDDIPSILERLSPSADVPAEAVGSAQEHWKQRMQEVGTDLAGVRRLLEENYRRLSRQSLSRSERARRPDLDKQHDEIPIDYAMKLERRSRIAQEALNARAREFQRECDSAFQSAESCLEEAIQQTLDEQACLTARASTNRAVCDQEQRSPQAITLCTEIIKLLNEIERHRRLLCEETTTMLK